MRLNFGIYRAGRLIAKAENPEEAVKVAIVLGKGTSVKYAGRIVWKCLDSGLLQLSHDLVLEFASLLRGKIQSNYAEGRAKWDKYQDDARVGRINTLNNPICRLHGNSNCNHCDI